MHVEHTESMKAEEEQRQNRNVTYADVVKQNNGKTVRFADEYLPLTSLN